MQSCINIVDCFLLDRSWRLSIDCDCRGVSFKDFFSKDLIDNWEIGTTRDGIYDVGRERWLDDGLFDQLVCGVGFDCRIF